MIWENIFTRCLHFYFLFLFQQTDLTNLLLRSFDSFRLCFADEAMAGTYNCVSLIVKTILLELASTFSTPAAAKLQCFFFYLSFISNLQLFNGTSSNLQKYLGIFKILFAPSATMSLINLSLYLKDLKASVF